MLNVAILIATLDQITKYIVEQELLPGDVIEIIPNLFNLVLTFNKGVAFGIFSGIEADSVRFMVLGVTTLFALGAVWLFAKQPGSERRSIQIALGMILGGAIGNVLDRVLQGSVTDFLDFYYGTYHWPAFNVADSAICVAVALLIFIPQPKA